METKNKKKKLDEKETEKANGGFAWVPLLMPLPINVGIPGSSVEQSGTGNSQEPNNN